MTTDATIDGRIVRGLTLWRPWPAAFTHADKRVENRPWRAPRWLHLDDGSEVHCVRVRLGGSTVLHMERALFDRMFEPEEEPNG